MKKISKVIMASLLLFPLAPPLTQALFVDSVSAATLEHAKPIITNGLFVGSKTISGTATPGATIQLWVAYAVPNTNVPEVVADSTGHWTMTFTNGLIEGDIQIKSNYNRSSMYSDRVHVGDHAKPIITNGLFVGSKTISGTATPSAEIQLGVTNAVVDTNVPEVVADSAGHWTMTFTNGLIEGDIQVKSNYNKSSMYSDSVRVVGNVQPVITSSVFVGAKMLSGTAASGAVVMVWNNLVKIGTVTADIGGDWEFTVPNGLSAGPLQVVAYVGEAVGEGYLASDLMIVWRDLKAVTTGEVTFKENTSSIPILNPLDPDKGVTPQDPTSIVGTVGPLGINYISNFKFNNQFISGNDETYYASLDSIKLADATVVATPNFLQVSDNRRTNAGWKLQVQQGAQFKSGTDELIGASLELTNPIVKAAKNNTSTAPTANSSVKIVPGTAATPGASQDVLKAEASQQGTETWLESFGDATTGAKSVSLNVPGSTPKVKDGEYTTQLTWILLDSPV